jgi:hypothetical protein
MTAQAWMWTADGAALALVVLAGVGTAADAQGSKGACLSAAAR